MGRVFGSKNRRYRAAQRDRRAIGAAMQRVRVVRAYADRFTPDADGTVGGVSVRHAHRVLWGAMERVACLSEAERERLERQPPPAAPETQQHRACLLRMAGQ